MRLPRRFRSFAGCLVAALVLVASPAAASGHLTLVSVRPDGVKANGTSMRPSLSADGGRVAFVSTATNLVATDRRNDPDAYVKDLRTGAVILASGFGPSGNLIVDALNGGAVLSGDGSKVAFVASRTEEGALGIYVKDFPTGALRFIGAGRNPALSEDGSTLAYTTRDGVMVVRLDGGAPVPVAQVEDVPSLSGDGSLLTGLGRLGAFDTRELPLLNLRTGAYIALVEGEEVSAGTISADGTTVSFAFRGLGGASFPAIVDVASRRVDFVETPSLEVFGDEDLVVADPFVEDLSADGDVVAGTYFLLRQPPGSDEVVDRSNVFVTDQRTGRSRFVALRSDGRITTGTSSDASLDASGGLVAFTSTATDLVAADTDPGADIYLADLSAAGQPGLGCTITGTAGDDVLHGTAGSDVICAGAGDDVVWARGGDDIVYGFDGADRIYGGDGDDRLHGMGGDDAIFAGAGHDHVRGDAGADTVFGGSGDDSIWGGAGRDTLHGGFGDDDVRAGAGADVVRSGPGADYLEGNAGDDDIRAVGGDDQLHGNLGDDRLVCYADPSSATGLANGGDGTDTATPSCGRLLNIP